jgi:glycosyltransferase involved in cell wall biosynthesis
VANIPSQSNLFVVATPGRSVCDNNARALERIGKLRFLALGTRRGTAGVPAEHTRLNPWIGLLTYMTARTLSSFASESFRYRLLPWFDHWVFKQLQPGDHIISSYGYVNKCFAFVRKHGGKTFLDGGNSHIENFWEVMSEEHHRWHCPYPPGPPYWFERSRAMLAEVDYVLSPSSYVTKSFLARGFTPEQILKNVYPVDLSLFQPDPSPRPENRPLTLINTGSLSLRKGTPYLLEAFRLVRRKIPGARLLLTHIIEGSMRPILPKYRDLPIEWAPPLPHSQLAERLRGADIFVLPSLEEGLVRTALEAMACGLPVVLTPHTGANDLVVPGVNGEVVPIRDPQAIADAVLKWADKILAPDWQPHVTVNQELLTFEYFAKTFIGQLQELGSLELNSG